MHIFNQQGMKEFQESYQSLASHAEELLRINSSPAQSLYGYWLRLANAGWALSFDSHALQNCFIKVNESVRLLLEAHKSPGEEITHSLCADGELTTIALADRTPLMIEDWICGVHTCLLLRRVDQVPLFLEAATSLLDNADQGEPQYRVQYAQALRQLLFNGKPEPKTLYDAMVATDPESLSEEEAEEALAIYIHDIVLLNEIGKENYPGFNEKLNLLLADHARHYGLAAHANDWRGVLRLGTTALCCIVKDRAPDALELPDTDYLAIDLI